MQEDKILKRVRNLTILQAVIFIVAGIALIANPERMSNLLGFLLGALCFGLGIYRLVIYFRHQRLESYLATELFLGVGLAVLGFVCLLYHGQVMSYVTVIFGLFLIAGSVIKMQNCMILQKLNHPNWWICLIMGLISIVFSVFVIIKPKFIADVFLVVVGWFLLYDGATSLATVIFSEMFMKKLRNGYVPPVQPLPQPNVGEASGESKDGKGGGLFHFHKPSGNEEAGASADAAGAASEGMTGIPEPEKPKKKKGGFPLFHFKKDEDTSNLSEGEPEHMQNEVIRPETPDSDAADASYKPLDDDPFSSNPTHDAVMEGVSFDAVPGTETPAHESGAASEETVPEEAADDASAYEDPLPELKPDEDASYTDPLPELKPDEISYPHPLPELKPDPLSGDPVSEGMHFDPETGEPLDS